MICNTWIIHNLRSLGWTLRLIKHHAMLHQKYLRVACDLDRFYIRHSMWIPSIVNSGTRWMHRKHAYIDTLPGHHFTIHLNITRLEFNLYIWSLRLSWQAVWQWNDRTHTQQEHIAWLSTRDSGIFRVKHSSLQAIILCHYRHIARWSST